MPRSVSRRGERAKRLKRATDEYGSPARLATFMHSFLSVLGSSFLGDGDAFLSMTEASAWHWEGPNREFRERVHDLSRRLIQVNSYKIEGKQGG